MATNVTKRYRLGNEKSVLSAYLTGEIGIVEAATKLRCTPNTVYRKVSALFCDIVRKEEVDITQLLKHR